MLPSRWLIFIAIEISLFSELSVINAVIRLLGDVHVFLDV